MVKITIIKRIPQFKELTQREKDARYIVVKDAIRNSVRLARWSRDVRMRDGVCQKCGASVGITAHHIHGLKKMVVEFGITNPDEALKCDALFDVNNGITLCRNCHDDVHR